MRLETQDLIMKNAIRRRCYKWIAVCVVSVGSSLNTLDSGSMRIALPQLGHVFQASPNAVVWVLLIYMLVGTGLMLILGRVGDVFGRKRVYCFGLIIHTMGLGLCAVSQSLIQLVLFRWLQAIGDCMTVAMGYAIITAAFPTDERGRAMGMMGAVTGIGLLTGPVVGGFLLDLLGWRSIFYFRLPVGIIGIALALAFLKEQSFPGEKERFDFIGAIALFVALTCLLLTVNRGQSLGWGSPWVLALGATGVASLLFFLIVENKAEYPVLDLSLFYSRLFSSACVSHMFLHMSLTAISFLLPYYLIQGLSFNAATAGLFLVTIPALGIVLSPLSGRLSDRLGSGFLCASGLTIVSAGFLLLSGIEADASTAKVIGYLIILGMGKALFVPPNTSAIMGSVPPDKLGTASAMIGTLRQIGITIGLTIASSIFAASQNFYADQLVSQGIAENVVRRLAAVNGFQDAIFAIFFTAIAGLAATLLRGRK